MVERIENRVEEDRKFQKEIFAKENMKPKERKSESGGEGKRGRERTNKEANNS